MECISQFGTTSCWIQMAGRQGMPACRAGVDDQWHRFRSLRRCLML